MEFILMFRLVKEFLEEQGVYVDEAHFLMWLDENSDRLSGYKNTYCLKLKNSDWLIIDSKIVKNENKGSNR